MQTFPFSRTRIRPLRTRQIATRYRWSIWLPVLCYLCGITAGAIIEAQSRANSQAYALYFVKQVLSVYAGGSFTQVMGYNFLCQFALQSIVLFFSFSCIGTPAILCMPLLKGITLGCVSGYLYAVRGFAGVCANLFLFWLPQILEACLLFFFVSRALLLSSSLFTYNVLEQKSAGTGKVQSCVIAFLMTSLGGIGTSLLSGLLSAVFAPVFFAGTASTLSL